MNLTKEEGRPFYFKHYDGKYVPTQKIVKPMNLPIKRLAIENPILIISSHIRKPDQIIQPWQFGHGETKATCLWLKNLQLLVPTNVVDGREARIHKMAPSKDRWKERSRTYTGYCKEKF